MNNHGVLLRALITLALVLPVLPASAKKSSPLSDDESAAITQRGRMLAEYETAAGKAIKAVAAMHPEQGTIERYIARKSADGWVVVFGRYNGQHDKFLLVYEVAPGTDPKLFTAKKDDPPKEDAGFFFFAARAIDAAMQDFQGEKRPYHAAVLPAESNQMYVYVYPVPATPGVYPLGGDVRYLLSPDGSTIVARRQLHRAIIESRGSVPKGAQVVGGFHSHVLSDVPEDTDVFYVLTRKPRAPEFVAAGGHMYEILIDGTIRVQK
jgi:hypothetical protein